MPPPDPLIPPDPRPPDRPSQRPGPAPGDDGGGGPADAGPLGPDGGVWPPVTVVAVDDHPIVLEGLSTALRQLPGIELIGTARSAEELLTGPGQHADVVLLDLSLGDGSNPPDTIRALIDRGIGVAVYSAAADATTVRLAIRAGAAAFVSKTDQMDDLAKAVLATADGSGWISPSLAFMLLTDDAPDRPRLSTQESQALQLYAAGMSMKMVASRMGIAVETAKQYIDRVRRKYREIGREATTKIDLLHRAVEDGYLEPPGPGGPTPPA